MTDCPYYQEIAMKNISIISLLALVVFAGTLFAESVAISNGVPTGKAGAVSATVDPTKGITSLNVSDGKSTTNVVTACYPILHFGGASYYLNQAYATQVYEVSQDELTGNTYEVVTWARFSPGGLSDGLMVDVYSRYSLSGNSLGISHSAQGLSGDGDGGVAPALLPEDTSITQVLNPDVTDAIEDLLTVSGSVATGDLALTVSDPDDGTGITLLPDENVDDWDTGMPEEPSDGGDPEPSQGGVGIDSVPPATDLPPGLFANWVLNDEIMALIFEAQAQLEVEASAPASAPEPMTLALFGAGLAGLGFVRRRKR
jgi:PEP-CTERM motif